MNSLLLVTIILVSLSYFSGCVPYSVLISKIFTKTDIRTLGNGNPGASNTVANLGWKYGAAVGLLDIVKAVLPVIIARSILTNFFPNLDDNMFKTIIYLCGGAAIIGHIFSVFLLFKGGKGTASLVGTMLAIDIKLGLIGVLAIVLITIISNYIALGTMGLLTVFIVGTVIFHFTLINLALALIIALISFIKHYRNFKQILAGTEPKLKSTF